MNSIDKRKLAYDSAQKLGERVERMTKEEGWNQHFIPTIQKKRDEAQVQVNSLSSDQRVTDFNRGLIEAYDFILGYENEKIKQALANMKKNTTAKLEMGSTL